MSVKVKKKMLRQSWDIYPIKWNEEEYCVNIKRMNVIKRFFATIYSGRLHISIYKYDQRRKGKKIFEVSRAQFINTRGETINGNNIHTERVLQIFPGVVEWAFKKYEEQTNFDAQAKQVIINNLAWDGIIRTNKNEQIN